MWVFLNNAFLSVVADREDLVSDRLLVRARLEGDIERVFPEAEVRVLEGSDYEFRAWVPRYDVAKALAGAVFEIEYANFKNSIPKGDVRRKDSYYDVWHAMLRAQHVARRTVGTGWSRVTDAIHDRFPNLMIGHRLPKCDWCGDPVDEPLDRLCAFCAPREAEDLERLGIEALNETLPF